MHVVVRVGRLRRLLDARPRAGVAPPGPQAPVVISTPRGLELGTALATVAAPSARPSGLVELVRTATLEDLGRAAALGTRAEADRTRLQALLEPLRLVAAERPLEAAKDAPDLVLYYGATARVDVPAALKAGEALVGGHLELVQVGARERARACGGAGVCGRTLCCSTFLRKLEPVTMRMAKLQGVSLDPESTAGACGRLKCCLRYEVSTYEDARRRLPRPGWTVEARRASGVVLAVDPLRRRLLVRGDGRPEAAAPVVLFADEVTRSTPPPRPPGRGPLPLAGDATPPGAPAAPEAPPAPERGWSELARRLWRRARSGRLRREPPTSPPGAEGPGAEPPG